MEIYIDYTFRLQAEAEEREVPIVEIYKCEAVNEVVSLEISTECEESYEIDDITPVVSVVGEIEYEDVEDSQDFQQSSHSATLKRMGR